MIDIAHEETDRIIETIERRLRRIYKRAAKEAEEKANAYFEGFKQRDAAKLREVNAGLLSKREYGKWRKNQILVGERWKEMRDNLATDFHHTNEMAKSIMKEYAPEVYALNHNYATYSIEAGASVNTSYTLYNADTVKRLVRENPKLLPSPDPTSKTGRLLAANKDLRWNRRKIQEELTQGILQGESLPKVAKRLHRVTDMDNVAAARNARTMMTGAQNAGREDAFQRAVDLGVKMRQMWDATLDGRTRHSHRVVDGETVEVGEVFDNGCRYPGDPEANPAEVYNCRCSLRAVIDGVDYSDGTRFSRLGGMSYEDWKKGKGG